MHGQSGMIVVTLTALLVGGCATQPGVIRGNKDYPYEKTDRPIIPKDSANRPIMALDFSAHESDFGPVQSALRRGSGNG
jgi:hypothetical protein